MNYSECKVSDRHQPIAMTRDSFIAVCRSCVRTEYPAKILTGPISWERPEGSHSPMQPAAWPDLAGQQVPP